MANRESHTEAQQGPPPARRSSGGTSSKLRDSCHTCAVSKVKCPKEKPTCSRCESRGTPCQYFLTKRPGRRRESEINGSRAGNNRSGTSVNGSNQRHEADGDGGRSRNRERDGDTIRAAPPSLSDRFFSRSTTPPNTRSPQRDSYPGTPTHPTLPSPPPLDHVLVANPSDIFSALGEDGLFPDFADFNSDVNDMDFVMSGIDSPFGLLMLDTGGGGNIAVAGPRPDIGSLLMPLESNGNDLTAGSETSSTGDAPSASSSAVPSSLESSAQSLTASLSNVPRAIESPSCGCLMQGLDLLKVLSSTQSTPHTSSSGGTPEPSLGIDILSSSNSSTSSMIGSDSLARAVLERNKQSIEAVNHMLACVSCTGDSFLLTVSSMIVLKVLERYASAARGCRSGIGETDLGRVANMMMAHGGAYADQGLERRSAQVVLSELHRVQRVVNQLSPKLKAPLADGGGQGIGSELDFWGQGHHMTVGVGQRRDTTPASFSTDTLNRLEKDVRKSLSSLSSDIIEVLRQS
ncbi:uncharacterized protein B0H64DRAFT_45474 [Chaetomium fimeti]|uniref:Zn(2)-C6 fungal-type domain-containing protein n=1 Tax=Chaetomium fimeti TaxID=1854472 RepID=A0AAE0H7K3_9PEZI|nr:hypothetical protein B0H64DRAFT_45474 [Chaetomium fimeti]